MASTVEHVLLENDGQPKDEEEYHGTPPVLPPRQPLPFSVKVCGVVTLFTIAVIVGSTGHAAYEAAFTAIGEAEYVASASLIAGLDHTANICTDPWDFFCGKYEKSHYMSGSRIGDLSVAEWRKALKAYESQKTGQSAAFFDACVQRQADDASECDIVYSNTTTLRDLWRAGVAHSNIAISRMAHPDPARVNERSVVMWALDDTSGVEVYPVQIDQNNDPCKLVDLFELVMCPDWATAASCKAPQFLVAGNITVLCEAWTIVATNSNSSAEAMETAIDSCYARAARLSTPLGCFLRTAEYYPDTNVPYLAELRRTSSTNEADIAVWFEAARSAVIEVAAPLGPKIKKRLEEVELHSGWTAQNLPTPPPQLSAALPSNQNVSFVKATALHDAWQMESVMRQTTQVHPRWAMNSWSINAYYSPSTNEIYVPDSMSVLINPLEPATVGTLVFILSHELGHSFDPSSTAFNSNLMTLNELEKYNNAKNCILSDYVNANETIGEDFADFIGIQAIATYVEEKMKTKNEIKVKERVYTPAQQTLAAFGGFWCASTDNDAAPGERRDPHSLPRDRVVQAVFKSTSAFGFGPCPSNPLACQFATVQAGN